MIMFIIIIIIIDIVKYYYYRYRFNYLIFTYVPQVGRVSHRFGHFSRCAQTAGIKEYNDRSIDRETHPYYTSCSNLSYFYIHFALSLKYIL